MSDDFSDVVTADVIGSCDVLTMQFTLNPDEMRRVLIASGLPQLVRDVQRELAKSRKDVERYRWLRKGHNAMLLINTARWVSPEQMDAAIDLELLAANAGGER